MAYSPPLTIKTGRKVPPKAIRTVRRSTIGSMACSLRLTTRKSGPNKSTGVAPAFSVRMI
jgi:hypothetical protein